MAKVERFAIGGVTRDITHGKLLKAAFENELEEGRRADPSGPTDHAQFHPESPRRDTVAVPDNHRRMCPEREKYPVTTRRERPTKWAKMGSPGVLSGV